MKKILIEVRDMAFGDEPDLEYSFPSYLLKQKLTVIIKERYKGMYTYFKKGDNVFKVIKSKNYVPPSEQVNSIQDSLISSEEDKYSDTRSEDELNLKKIQETHSAKIINLYRNEIGFSLIIEEMINSKKPLIGHNCIYDICFLYDQFIGPLPSTFLKFTSEWRNLFPEIYDSKYISYKYQGKLFYTTQLGSLYKK